MEIPTQAFSNEIREIFESIYFEEHLRTTASVSEILNNTAVKLMNTNL